MSELEEKLALLKQKHDGDYLNADNVHTLVDGIVYAMSHGGNVSVAVTPVENGYKITVISEGVTQEATVQNGGDAYEVYKSTVPEGQTPMNKTEWLASLKGEKGDSGHNPCLGRLNTLPADLDAAFPNAIAGDYIYVDSVNNTTTPPTTTTTVYHYVDSTNGWDSGTAIEVNDATFTSGQSVSTLPIKDLDGENDSTAQGVLSGEAGAELAGKTNEVNVGGAASFAAAIALVPQGMKKAGVTIVYYDTTVSEWKAKKYMYPSLSTSTWNNEQYWVDVADDSSPFVRFRNGGLTLNEQRMIDVVKDIKLYGSTIDESKRYMVREVSRNRGTTPGYEIIISEVNSDGTQVVLSVISSKKATADVTEDDGITTLKYNKNGVTVIISVDFNKIEDGGIINLASTTLHYMIMPSKVKHMDETPTEGSDSPVTSGGVYTALANKASNSDLTALTAEVEELALQAGSNPVFINIVGGTVGATEKRFLEAVKDIKVYGSGVDESKHYMVREVSRNRPLNQSTAGYELVLSTVETNGSHTAVLQQKLPTSSVTETNGITTMVYSTNNINVEISIDYSKIEDGGIINVVMPTLLHYAIVPSKVTHIDNAPTEGSSSPITSGGVKAALDEFTPPTPTDSGMEKPYYVENMDKYDTGTALTFKPTTERIEHRYIGQLTPEKRYMSVGFDDFRDTDFSIYMPLFEKYGFKSTFDRVARLSNLNDVEELTNADKIKIDNLIKGKHELGDHTWYHYHFLFTEARFNGQDPDNLDGNQTPYPTNDMMRVDRGDGKNVFGINLTTPVSTTINYQGPSIDTAWGSLSDAECQTIRNWFSVMKDTNTNLILALDALSNRFLGTSGSSRDSWDNDTQQYTGGIFTGCKTSANHEIWERILTVTQMYYREVCGINYNIKTWSLPGSKFSYCWFEHDGKKYYDAGFTQLVNYTAKFESSTLKNPDGSNKVRSWNDCLREFGYTVTHDTLFPGKVDGSMPSFKVIRRQLLLNSKGRRTDALLFSSNASKNFSYEDARADYPETSMTGTTTLAEQMYDNAAKPAFHNFIEAARRNMANGVVDVETTDSFDTYSMRVFYEGLLKYCKATGVELLTRQEAYDLCFSHELRYGNLVYNPNLRNTAKEFMPNATTVPSNPDGYVGNCSVSHEEDGTPVLVTSGNTNYAHYGIPYGTLRFKAKVKGTGTISIGYIKNNTDYNLSSGVTFPYIESVNSSSEFTEVTIPFEVKDVPRGQYDQIYEGYGDKIVGVLIQYSSGLQVKNIEIKLD